VTATNDGRFKLNSTQLSSDQVTVSDSDIKTTNTPTITKTTLPTLPLLYSDLTINLV